MIRVNLSIYKKSIKFFYLFDALIKNEIKKIYEFMHIIFVNSNTTHDKYWIDGEIPITYSNDEIKKII